MFRFIIYPVLLLLLNTASINAQLPNLNVHHLTTKEGLSDGVVRSIGQDKYGFIWIGTTNGLNRFDGTKVRRFQNDPEQKNSIPPSIPRYILGDSMGNLWIGFNQGLYRYDFANEVFLQAIATPNLAVIKIIERPVNKELYLLTDKGILCYQLATGETNWLTTRINNQDFVLHGRDCKDLEIRKDTLYAIVENNIYEVNLVSREGKILEPGILPKGNIQMLTAAPDGTLYVCANSPTISIRMLNADKKHSTEVVLAPEAYDITLNNKVISLLADKSGRLWVTTTSKWLFSKEKDKPVNWHSFWFLRSNSVSGMLTSPLFEAKDGFFWLATEGYGVDYFHPKKNFFSTISPYENPDLSRSSAWARASTEDKSGNIWMGWSAGVSRHNLDNDSYRLWENFKGKPKTLHNNSVRSLAEDANGDIWIGTAKGVNCYKHRENKMLFYSEKDSLPERFYWSIFCDSRHDVWFGSGSGLYRRNSKTGHIVSSKSITGLQAAIDTGVRVIFEDHRSQLWFGLDGNGLVKFDPVKQTARKWIQTTSDSKGLLGNTITAITEDRSGKVWVSSFNGLVSYNPESDEFDRFGLSKGLPGLKCAGILTDSADRIWVATSGGLAVLDQNRKQFTTYTAEDGLVTTEFTDMPATKLRNGDFLFPTIHAYIQFNPRSLQATADSLHLYLSSIRIFDKPYKTKMNTEEVNDLHLKSFENFFSFDLVALNYNNPNQTMYSYMLEGFDKDWITSNNGLATYTNVPGGNYRFRFKASTESENWKVPEKIITVRIDTVFYKSAWFWILSFVALLTLLYAWYNSRLREQKNIFQLKSKAQNLEKEKALAMFEALKQQLNPHFLFNSLSSLSSLIRTDQKLAGIFLDSLSKIYRYILQSRETDLLSLEEEIKFVSSYIRLLETRFQTGLKIEIDIDNEYLQKKIVPVTLQNLIDNAIKHNRMNEDAPLLIRIFANGQYLTVENNMQRKQLVETSNRQGLKNLQSLYRYMTDLPILIEENNESFQIKIPLI